MNLMNLDARFGVQALLIWVVSCSILNGFLSILVYFQNQQLFTWV